MDMNGTLTVWDQPRRCVLCHRILSSEIELNGEVEATTSICGDCKYLFLEDHNIQHSSRQTSSESIENIQFSELRRWRRAISDSESDGFDSDVSVEVDSNTTAHLHQDDASLNHSDDDDEFENTVGRVQLHRSLATNGRNLPADWLNEILSPESEENLERSRYVGNAGDYLDARGFEQLLERLAENDGSRRGPPPAAVSFVKNLERVVVEDGDGGLVCVICKDSVCVGSVVNRLPCLHVYHPSCIMPWLSARNTCPLCRYELPTECERRRRRNSRSQQVEMEEDASSGGGGRWWVVAAPLVGMVAIGVVVWLGGGVGRSRKWWCV